MNKAVKTRWLSHAKDAAHHVIAEMPKEAFQSLKTAIQNISPAVKEKLSTLPKLPKLPRMNTQEAKQRVGKFLAQCATMAATAATINSPLVPESSNQKFQEFLLAHFTPPDGRLGEDDYKEKLADNTISALDKFLQQHHKNMKDFSGGDTEGQEGDEGFEKSPY